VAVLSQRGARVRDARLTELADTNTIGQAGATISAALTSHSSSLTPVELIIPPDIFTTDTAITLTALSPQGLIAPVPLGWSVLLGADIQASGSSARPEALEGQASGSSWATLRVPPEALSPLSLPIVAAIWDDQTRQWRAGPEVTETTDAIEIPVPNSAFPIPNTAFQMALLVPDSADLQAVEGQPLPTTEPLLVSDLSAVLLANPLAMVSDLGSRSVVQAEMFTQNVPPSGTVIEARLSESYHLRDGSFVEGVSSQQDLALYRQSAIRNPQSEIDLAAYFPVAPSIAIPLSDLVEGRITVDLLRPEAAPAEEPGVITPEHGGDATGRGDFASTCS
jgi:hypothetical protein